MFWQYPEWTNAFLIQIIAIIVAVIYGKKNQIENTDLFLVISLVSPVAIVLVSKGVSGAIFLSDLTAVYLLFRSGFTFRKERVIGFAFILFLLWPIISTLISVVFSIIYQTDNFDGKIFLIQTFRYFLYFVLFAKLIAQSFEPAYLAKIFKVQSIMLLFIFTSILLGYFNFIKIDAWNELIKYDQQGFMLGKGGMFLYRGGVGTLGAISIPIIYFCFIRSEKFYKYLMAGLILIIFLAVLFSGSRQGVFFVLLSFILSIILFKQYKQAIKILIIGSIVIFFLLQNQTVNKTSVWVLNRYNILLDKNISLVNEINKRNSAIDISEKQESEFIYLISGKGFGGKIIPTESDYYNTFSYFGFIGLIIYISFIFYTCYKIYLNLKSTNDELLKHIFLIIFIISVTIPLFGIQQWYIMTYASANCTNVFLILFLFSINSSLKKENI